MDDAKQKSMTPIYPLSLPERNTCLICSGLRTIRPCKRVHSCFVCCKSRVLFCYNV